MSWAAAAAEGDIGAEELREISREGRVDEVRSVTHIDGVPYDLDAVLGPGPVAGERLEAIARLEGPGFDPTEAAGIAADVLSEPRFRLERTWMERLTGFLQELWLRLLDLTARLAELVGGPVVLAIIVLGLIVGTAVLVTLNLGKRRARTVADRIRREREAVRGVGPEELERQAATAAGNGDHGLAVRLLFRAGLVRLDRQGAIDLRPGMTSGQVGAALTGHGAGNRATFARLADRFDQIVYGGAVAGPDDTDETRRAWAELLGAVRH